MSLIKNAALAAMAILVTAGAAVAAPQHGNKWNNGGSNWNNGGRVSGFERAVIAQARANLNVIKARAWRDGRVTGFERYQIRLAEARLQRAIFRARHG